MPTLLEQYQILLDRIESICNLKLFNYTELIRNDVNDFFVSNHFSHQELNNMGGTFPLRGTIKQKINDLKHNTLSPIDWMLISK